jgi:hypothetical protein
MRAASTAEAGEPLLARAWTDVNVRQSEEMEQWYMRLCDLYAPTAPSAAPPQGPEQAQERGPAPAPNGVEPEARTANHLVASVTLQGTQALSSGQIPHSQGIVITTTQGPGAIGKHSTAPPYQCDLARYAGTSQWSDPTLARSCPHYHSRHGCHWQTQHSTPHCLCDLARYAGTSQ